MTENIMPQTIDTAWVNREILKLMDTIDALRSENEGLKLDISRLRQLVREAYREGWQDRCNAHDETAGEELRQWDISTARREVEGQ